MTPLSPRAALRFVIAFGVVSLFADMTYEGMRSISGPYLALLGASGAAVGLIAGVGELLGYVLRLASGSAADRSRLYWPITLIGYVVQMAVVPALALTGGWRTAAVLIILERIGKATRNPPRDVMLSQAGESIGQGWAFGLHEALDQSGAIMGPLLAAFILSIHGDFHAAFAWLLLPAAITVLLVSSVRIRYPSAGRLPSIESPAKVEHAARLSRAFWLYAVGAGLVAFGFADYALIAYHYAVSKVMPSSSVAVLYACAMGAGGLGSLLGGRSYDRFGLKVLLPATFIIAAYAPLVFLGGFSLALIGTVLWGVGIGVHETVMSAAIAQLVPVLQRGRAYGVFTAIFGICWFAGSVVLGVLYDHSLTATAWVAALAQLLGIMPIAMTVAELRAARN
ncbi:MAG TPA: MFS transporter [Steroidobacteraceae bacterium]|nr:MFS transporter [Steroidobacteraceae bacterium]